MTLSILLLVVSLALILAAAELFTNGIEWFGKRLNLSEGAVGSVLAAVGTALPETTIPVIALIAAAFNPSQAHANTEAGIGAMLGAPMMLSTLAMFVTGAAILIFAKAGIRKANVLADYRVIGRDLKSFFLVYMFALAAAFIDIRWIKIVIGLFLITVYVLYVRRTFKEPSAVSHGEELSPLHFHRHAEEPHFPLILVQLVVALGLMVVGAMLFLNGVTFIAEKVHLSSLVLSLIIAPIATELPEKFNSVTWVRQKKDTLALGNISGAMVFQSSIIPAIGILFTAWKLDADALASIVIAILASSIIWAEMTIKKRLSPYSLLIGGLLYALFPIYVFVIRPH